MSTANKVKGTVVLEHDGQSFTLCPSFDALCSIEGRLDMGILGLLQRLGRLDVRMRDLRIVLLETSKEGGKQLTRDQVGEILMRRMGEIADIVTNMIGDAFGDATGAAAGKT